MSHAKKIGLIQHIVTFCASIIIGLFVDLCRSVLELLVGVFVAGSESLHDVSSCLVF